MRILKVKVTPFNAIKMAAMLAVLIAVMQPVRVLAEEEELPEMRKADALFNSHKIKEATEAYRDAIRKQPDNSKAHERLGACLAETARLSTSTASKDDFETAILEENTAIRLDKAWALPHSMLGQIYVLQGKVDEAIAEFQQAIKIKPNSLLAYLDLGLTLTCAGKDDEAMTVYKKAIELDPKDCRAHLNLGVLYNLKDDFTNAVKEEALAIELAKQAKQPDIARNAPEYIRQANINLGNSYVNKGDYDQAIQAFKAALKINSKDANAISGLGWALGKKGDWKGSIAEQRKAILIADDFAVAHRRLAEALSEQGNKTEAETEFKTALEKAPADVTAKVQYAKFLEKQGRKGDAITEYKKALEINPQCKIAQDALNTLTKSQKQQ